MTNPSIQHVKMACHAGYKFENKRVDKCAFKFFILRIKNMANQTFAMIWLFLGMDV